MSNFKLQFQVIISHYRTKLCHKSLSQENTPNGVSREFNVSIMHQEFCGSNSDDKVSYLYCIKSFKK